MFGNAQAHRAVRVTMDDSTVNGMRKGVGLRPTTVLGMGLAIAILIAMPVAFADGAGTTYSGRAFGASVHVGPLDAKFADTGNLPAEGGEIDATTVTVHTDPAQAEVLLSVTMGFDEKAESEAATASVTLLPGSANEVTAAFVRSDSEGLRDRRGLHRDPGREGELRVRRGVQARAAVLERDAELPRPRRRNPRQGLDGDGVPGRGSRAHVLGGRHGQRGVRVHLHGHGCGHRGTGPGR